MGKFHVTIQFTVDEEFQNLIPPHRTYINYLINKGVIDQYAVSLEVQRAWVTLSAKNKKEVDEILTKSPLSKFWTWEVNELFLLDGQSYRLPAVLPN